MSVAVIIPFYNAQKYLGEAIQSCIIQKEVSQIILIDDGSNDDSRDIAQRYVDADQRVEIIVHPHNQGRSAARNTGMKVVKSPFFSFLDADDWYEPKRFINVIRCLQSMDDIHGVYEAVISHIEESHRHPDIPESTMITDEVSPEDLFDYLVAGKGHFSIIGCLFKSEMISKELQFDTDLTMGEDTDWLWRVARQKRLQGLHSEAKVVRRIHGANSYFNEEERKYWKHRFYKKWLGLADEVKLSWRQKRKLKKSMEYYS